MMVPTVHLNGTSKEELINQLCNASEALENAFQVLKKAAPNGRDYYPQSNTALDQATKEHFVRLAAIDAVKKEIDELTCKIDEQR